MSIRPWRQRALGALALCGAGLALNPVAHAQDAPGAHTVTANVGLISNYVFRGMTYTQERPAVQGGFDYAHDSGLYAGVWGTNVSSEAINGASLEIDVYGGYAWQHGDWHADIGLLQFYYPEHPRLPGSRERYDTLEAHVAAGWRMLSLKYSHTLTDFFGFNAASMGAGRGRSRGSGYLVLSAEFPLAQNLVLDGHLGRQRVRNYGEYNYTDWRLGLTHSFGTGWTATLAYTDTDADDALWVADGKRLGRAHWIIGLARQF